MSHVRLSARAQSDLVRLRKFLLEKDTHVAQRALLAIRDAFKSLQHAPLIGRPVEDHEYLRELIIEYGASGYVALYRFESQFDVVTILAIKHQREDDYK